MLQPRVGLPPHGWCTAVREAASTPKARDSHVINAHEMTDTTPGGKRMQVRAQDTLRRYANETIGQWFCSHDQSPLEALATQLQRTSMNAALRDDRCFTPAAKRRLPGTHRFECSIAACPTASESWRSKFSRTSILSLVEDVGWVKRQQWQLVTNRPVSPVATMRSACTHIASS